MKVRARFALAVAIVLASLSLAVPILGDLSCNDYSNSEMSWVQGYGAVCAGSGAGCTECWDSESGTTCVDEEGGKICKLYPYNRN